MKKIILTLLILITGTSVFAKPNYTYTMSETPASAYSGTYVDEEITTPLTQIGIPEEYLEPQAEEQGLEIEWNEWHEKVRDYIFDNIDNGIPDELLSDKNWNAVNRDSLHYLIYTVHKSGAITDVIILTFHRAAGASNNKYRIVQIDNSSVLFSPEFDVCMRENGKNSFKNYIFTLNQDTILSSDKITDILKKSSVVKGLSRADSANIKYRIACMRAQNIESYSEQSFLNFPAQSRRDMVVVTQGFAHPSLSLNLLFTDYYDASNFNDTERIEY